jgi:hypothetical protein
MNREEPSVAVQTVRIDQQAEGRGIEQDAPANIHWTLFVLSFVAIIPIWTVRYPVLLDYPNHLARWFVLFHLKDGAYRFANLYASAWGPLPYISPDILAMALQYFFPVEVVGRCIISLCIILVPVATYFFLKKACPENAGLATFAILVAFNPQLLMGSISYMFSLAFCLLVVGLWVGYCRAHNVMTAVGVAIGLLLVYLSHLSGFVVAGLAMGTYTLFQEQRWKKLGILALFSFPALLIFLYHPNHAGSGASFVYIRPIIWEKLRHLFFPVRLYTTTTSDLIVLAGLAFLIFLVLIKRPKFVLQPVWLAVCAVLLLAYSLAPANYGFGGYVDKRFLPFLYLFSLGAIRFNRVPRRLVVGLALLVLFRVATWQQLFISQQRELNQLTASFEAIPRNARILRLNRLPKRGFIGTAGVQHLGYGVIRRGFLNPQLFHLPGVDPIRLAGSPYCPNVLCDVADAPDVDWQQVADSYDYLWVYRDPEIAVIASRIGDPMFWNDSVAVYRIRHPELH